MNAPRYSQAENERRFLVRSLGDVEFDAGDFVQIEDVYLQGTFMRLRRATSSDGTVIHKLCKKYPSEDSYSGAVVNVYLTPQEYLVFEAIPGRTLSKRRYHVTVGADEFGINVFEGQLAGLVLCEAEKPTREEVLSLEFPGWASVEVTEDTFFTGAHLAQIDRQTLQAELTSRGVR